MSHYGCSREPRFQWALPSLLPGSAFCPRSVVGCEMREAPEWGKELNCRDSDIPYYINHQCLQSTSLSPFSIGFSIGERLSNTSTLSCITLEGQVGEV